MENTIISTLTLEELNSLIQKVAKAEKVTKEGLSVLSRALLQHVYATGDVEPINTLLGTDKNGNYLLTPLNWRTAVQYFDNFVAFTSNYEKEVKPFAVKGSKGGQRVPMIFNKKSKGKFTRMLPTVTTWLAEESNDIWVWSANNMEMEASSPDFMKNAITAIRNAMDDEKGGFSISEILSAVYQDESVSVDLEEVKEFTVNPIIEEVKEAA